MSRPVSWIVVGRWLALAAVVALVLVEAGFWGVAGLIEWSFRHFAWRGDTAAERHQVFLAHARVTVAAAVWTMVHLVVLAGLVVRVLRRRGLVWYTALSGIQLVDAGHVVYLAWQQATDGQNEWAAMWILAVPAAVIVLLAAVMGLTPNTVGRAQEG